MDKMKPCPFCGSDGSVYWSWAFGETCTPTCSSGMCVGVNMEQDEQGGFAIDYKTEEEAIAAWNNRPIEDGLQSRIDELQAENERLRWHYPARGEFPNERNVFEIEHHRTFKMAKYTDFYQHDKTFFEDGWKFVIDGWLIVPSEQITRWRYIE